MISIIHGNYRTLLTMALLIAACGFPFNASAQAADGSYSLPRDWHGSVKGETDGNPILAEGSPRWAFYQLEGKDPSSAEAVKPMVWGGGNWVGPREFGGQPAVSVRRKTVTLASRGSWGSPGNQKGVKTAALAFIAPEPGTYTLEGKAQAEVWQGKAGVELVLYRHVPDESLTYVDSLDLEKGAEPVEIAGWSVTLKKGEQLVIAAIVARNHTAANVRVRGFQIVQDANADGEAD